MAKAKLHQIKLAVGNNATQPPFPGGWVLAIFDALNSYAPALAAKHRLSISQRTKERITRQTDWHGVQTREQVIKGELFKILRDEDEVERIFLIIKAQREY